MAFRHDPQDPESLGDDNVTSIAQDASGLIWVGTVRGGLNKCLAGLAKFEHFKRNASDPRSLIHNDIRAMWADGAGALWAGSRGGWLERIDGETGRVARYELAPRGATGPGGAGILAVREDSAGGIWVGTESDGLVRLDPGSGRLERYRHRSQERCGTLEQPGQRAVDRRGARGRRLGGHSARLEPARDADGTLVPVYA